MEDKLTVAKHYIRFLKEQGVYKRVLSLHRRNFNGKINAIFFNYNPARWIEDATAFCNWCETREGDIFWWPICILWQCECIINQYDDYSSPQYMLTTIESYLDFFNKCSEKEKTNISNYTFEALVKKLKIARSKMVSMT